MPSIRRLIAIAGLSFALCSCGDEPVATRPEGEAEAATASSPQAGQYEPTDSTVSSTESVERTTSEPTAAFRLVLTGIGSGLPVVGAVVRVVPEDQWHSAENLQSLSAHEPLPSILELPTVTTDDGGVASPAVFENPVIVLVRNADRWSWQRLESVDADETIRMAIADAASRRVQVVDQDGEPVIGVPVQTTPGIRLGGPSDTLLQPPRVTRAPDGIVDLTDLASARQMVDAMTRQMAEEDESVPMAPTPLTAFVDLLFPEPPHVGLPLTESSEVHELRLPPSGSLFVRTEGVTGASGVVRLAGTKKFEHYYELKVPALRLVDGELLVPHVGLGLRLELALQLDGESGERMLEIAGPTSPGQQVEAVFELQPLMAISGTLLDSRGKPITADRVSRALASSRGFDPPKMIVYGEYTFPERQDVEPDAEGRFRVVLEEPQLGAQVHAVVIEFAGKEASWTGRFPVGPGQNDIGEMQLGAGPAIVAGRVVGPGGEGIEGAALSFEVEVSIPDGESWWQDYPGGTTKSGPDGAFRIPMTYEVDAGRIRASHDRYSQGSPVAVTAGATDLEVRMDAGGDLRLSCRTPEGFSTWEFSPVIRGQEGILDIKPEDEWIGPGIEAWIIRGIQPGTYTVGFRYRGFRKVILPTPGVLIEAGKVCSDPRLQEVDLATGLRKVEFTVVDVAGEALSEYDVHLIQGTKTKYQPGVERDGFLWVPLEAEFDIGIRSKEHGTALVRSVDRTVDVVLGPPPRVTFKLPDNLALDRENGRLHLGLTRAGEESEFDYWHVAWEAVAVSDDRTCSLAVPEAGSYLLFWFPDPTNGDEQYETTVAIDEKDLGGVVEVVKPAGLQ